MTTTSSSPTAAAKAGADAITQGGAAAMASFQELIKIYQSIASRNAAKLTSAVQALASAKSPTEFFELQQTLIRESIEAAVSDGQAIASLTSSVFGAAFGPMQKQFEAMQKPFKK